MWREQYGSMGRSERRENPPCNVALVIRGPRTSSRANWEPIQFLGPCANGRYAIGCRHAAPMPSLKRRGLNSSGSSLQEQGRKRD